MANRFSDIAKQMGAKVIEESQGEAEQKAAQSVQSSDDAKVEMPQASKQAKKTQGTASTRSNEIPTTRKTTALPLVLDIANKEVKERRNIASKINKSKKITEDDVVVEALELYFKKAENKSFLDAAYEKLKYLG